ncbi:MAG: phosphoglycerate mutase [Candidatus Bathyarchaeota archaeon B23]|nr:MAG: phosphoglycerate mutase [Candidatus Bathyarchaeota archaeon B23]
MKAVIVVGDGMADRPLRELGGKTPLEAVETPNLDEVARGGVCGIMDILSPGRPPGSDAANLALLGYDPYECYRGRGALEALGVGLEVREGDVALRGNFAALEDGVVVDRRAGRIDGAIFTDYLRDVRLEAHPEVEVLVRPTLGHRLVILLRGRGLSWRVSDIDPHRTGVPPLKAEPLDASPEAARTADILNKLYEALKRRMELHPINEERRRGGLPPANAILLRGAGAPPAVRTLGELYGVRGACVAVTPTVRGACAAAGLDLYDAPGATGGVDTDAVSKARVAERILGEYDLIYIHVKGADNASHDGDVEAKMGVIRKIDEMVGHLLDHVDPGEVYIAVTADHTSSTRVREHVGDPVPLAIAGPEVRVDDVEAYTERLCARGGLGRVRGVDLMPMLMSLLGHVERFGA